MSNNSGIMSITAIGSNGVFTPISAYDAIGAIGAIATNSVYGAISGNKGVGEGPGR